MAIHKQLKIVTTDNQRFKETEPHEEVELFNADGTPYVGGSSSSVGVGDFLVIKGQYATFSGAGGNGYMDGLLDEFTNHPEDVHSSGDSIVFYEDENDGPLIRVQPGVYSVNLGAAPHGTGLNTEEPAAGWGTLYFILSDASGPPPDYEEALPDIPPFETNIPLNRNTDTTGFLVSVTFPLVVRLEDSVITPVVMLNNTPVDWVLTSPRFGAVKIG